MSILVRCQIHSIDPSEVHSYKVPRTQVATPYSTKKVLASRIVADQTILKLSVSAGQHVTRAEEICLM